MMTTMTRDVTVIGGGVAGLFIALRTAELGLDVTLIEKSPTLADGASVRNEGWLHAGSYHATSSSDRIRAVEVARRCVAGSKEIKAVAPQAIEDAHKPSYALLRDVDRRDEVCDRWNEAGVLYQPVDIPWLTRLIPELSELSRSDAAAFRVYDLAVDTRILYTKLLADCRRLNVDVKMGAKFSLENERVAHVICADGKTCFIESQVYVYAAGYGTKHLLEQSFDITFPVRCWKSHLLCCERLATENIFCLDSGEAAMIHHGGQSIVGLNEDAFEVPEPSPEICRRKVDDIVDAVQRLFGVTPKCALAVACVKLDVPSEFSSPRDLNIGIFEPVRGHIAAFPGKMTESPVLANVVTQRVFERLGGGTEITRRPCDQMKWQRLGQAPSEAVL